MPLTLKPVLEKESDGRVAVAIHIDGADGRKLAVEGPTFHGSEREGRRVLRVGLEKHMRRGAVVLVDGKRHDDVDAALDAIVADAACSLFKASSTPRR